MIRLKYEHLVQLRACRRDAWKFRLIFPFGATLTPWSVKVAIFFGLDVIWLITMLRYQEYHELRIATEAAYQKYLLARTSMTNSTRRQRAQIWNRYILARSTSALPYIERLIRRLDSGITD